MDEIKVGDLITTYYAGFFKLEKIQGYDAYFTQVYTANGKPGSSKLMGCHKSYCAPYQKTLEKKFEEYQRFVKIAEEWPNENRTV